MLSYAIFIVALADLYSVGDGAGATRKQAGEDELDAAQPFDRMHRQRKLNEDLQTGTYNINFGNGANNLEMKINKGVPADSYDLVKETTSSNGKAAIHENIMKTGGLRLSLPKADKREKAMKIVESVKMLVRLGSTLRPAEQRLIAAIKNMPPGVASKARDMLGHIKALRGYSSNVLVQMQALTSKDVTPEARRAAVANLVHGLHDAQAGLSQLVAFLVYSGGLRMRAQNAPDPMQ